MMKQSPEDRLQTVWREDGEGRERVEGLCVGVDQAWVKKI